MKKLSWYVTKKEKDLNGDEFFLTVYSIPHYASLIESAYDRVCRLTNGWIGGHGLPDKFWQIPVGKPDYDKDDGMLNNSVAERLSSLESKVIIWAWDKQEDLLTVSITEAEYTQLSKASK